MRSRILIAGVLAGCGVSSAKLDLYASVDDRGEITRITLGAEQDHNDFSLDDTTATVHVGDQNIELKPSGEILYAEAALSVAAEQPVDFEIRRDDATTHITLGAPPPIDLVTQIPLFIPRSQDLTIAWMTANTDAMYWQVDSAECIDTHVGDIDPGATQVVIPAADLAASRDDYNNPTCTAMFSLARFRTIAREDDGFASVQLDYLRLLELPFASTP